MSDFFDNFSRTDWEDFCEIMIRQHYGEDCFWKVPDEDGGDLGIEFFTANGTIFQCYFPDMNVDMKKYKSKIQGKIRDDVKKLKTYESEISKLLDTVVIKQWVLLTPESRSKDLLIYCNKKKKEVIAENISYIDNSKFKVKIETADTYPKAKIYALGVHSKAIDIPLMEVTSVDKSVWEMGNSKFSGNINRKTSNLMGEDSEVFKDEVVTKYIQIEKFLDQLRTDHPDLHDLIGDSARAQLENIKQDSFFESKLGKEFVKKIVDGNREAFDKHAKYMSDTNLQSLSFGYMSKWFAECFMDLSK